MTLPRILEVRLLVPDRLNRCVFYPSYARRLPQIRSSSIAFRHDGSSLASRTHSGSSLGKGVGLAVLLLLTIIGTSCWPLSVKAQQNAPAQDEILNRMEQAQEPNPGPGRSYTVTREYSLSGHKHEQPISKVTAEISSTPRGKKKYEITRSSGSGIGKKIVLRILDWETGPIEGNSAINRHNYDFCFLREQNLDGRMTYVLRIVPKRKLKAFFNGEVWVDANTFRVRRIDGRLAKRPSWWVTQDHVVLKFAEVKGLWLHTSTEVTADIRIFGKYTLTAQEVNLTFVGRMASLPSPLLDACNGGAEKSDTAFTREVGFYCLAAFLRLPGAF